MNGRMNRPPPPAPETPAKPEAITKAELAAILHRAGKEVLEKRKVLDEETLLREPGFIEVKVVSKVLGKNERSRMSVVKVPVVHKSGSYANAYKNEGNSLDWLIEESIKELCEPVRPSRMYTYPYDQLAAIKREWKERAIAYKNEHFA